MISNAMFFSDLIGQTDAKASLVAGARSGRVPHAQLFLGPEGSGALGLALAYAAYLQCEEPGETDSCGHCRACVKTHKMVHPDVHYSYPTVGSKSISTEVVADWRGAFVEHGCYFTLNSWLNRLNAENKQGNINTDETRDITRKLSLMAYEGRYKILLLWLPEFLGKEGNRLLKLIEEPPDETVFLLVAENQEAILPTILSRCQLVKVPPLSDSEVADGLVRLAEQSRENAERTAFLANGNLAKALEMADDKNHDHADMFMEWLRSAYQHKGPAMAQWVDKMSGSMPINDRRWGRKDQKFLLEYGSHFLREMFVHIALGHTELRLPEAERAVAVKLARLLRPEQIERIDGLFNDCALGVERNANPKILFLDASIRLSRILRGLE
jgi:DNA polymerase-3 subunit delta'